MTFNPSLKKVALPAFRPRRFAACLAATLFFLTTSHTLLVDVASAKVVGIDVSRFQERIAWERVPTDRIRFAFVQASRGSGDDCTVRPGRCGTDGWYEFNYRNARAAGIPVGAYHRAFVNGDSLYEAKQDAREEAAVFLRRVGHLRRGDLLPVLDLEPPYDGLTPRQLRGWTAVWLRRVERRLGVKPMIYTSYYGWLPTENTRFFARAGHRLWVAHWGVRSPMLPAHDWSGRGFSVWQFTSSGRVRGIRGPVDLNRLGVRLTDVMVGEPVVLPD
jgi:GH25 family lysozyme M1 (1,4-beta-N-acetylmuramidase)